MNIPGPSPILPGGITEFSSEQIPHRTQNLRIGMEMTPICFKTQSRCLYRNEGLLTPDITNNLADSKINPLELVSVLYQRQHPIPDHRYNSGITYHGSSL
jgi:hypothetical protein